MTEIIVIEYCPKCRKHSTFTCSGSMTKGGCDNCGLSIAEAKAKVLKAMQLK